MKDIEIWKDISGYEGIYQVSSLGRVKRLKGGTWVQDDYWKRYYYKPINEKIISQHYDKSGYPTTNIKGKRTRVHRLVAETFIPNLLNKREVNHIDGIKNNNKLSNLEWVTRKENSRHAWDIGLCKSSRGKGHGVIMMNELGKELKQFEYIMDAFNYFGMKYRGCITEVCQGKRKHFNGYRWKYA